MSEHLRKVAATLGCLCLLTLIAVATVQGHNFTSRADMRRNAFVTESVSRLGTKPTPEQLRQIQAKTAAWQKTQSDSDWLELTDAIHAAAKNSNTKSDVTIASSRGNGAKVKYQTLGQRKRKEEPTTAKNLTEALESMYIGTYHIWSERDGKATSDKDDRYEIAKDKEKVTLQENK